jgi:hypothetical protein
VCYAIHLAFEHPNIFLIPSHTLGCRWLFLDYWRCRWRPRRYWCEPHSNVQVS